jgi:hypothetical protein
MIIIRLAVEATRQRCTASQCGAIVVPVWGSPGPV